MRTNCALKTEHYYALLNTAPFILTADKPLINVSCPPSAVSTQYAVQAKAEMLRLTTWLCPCIHPCSD
jgi:hypothetical protein